MSTERREMLEMIPWPVSWEKTNWSSEGTYYWRSDRLLKLLGRDSFAGKRNSKTSESNTNTTPCHDIRFPIILEKTNEMTKSLSSTHVCERYSQLSASLPPRPLNSLSVSGTSCALISLVSHRVEDASWRSIIGLTC